MATDTLCQSRLLPLPIPNSKPDILSTPSMGDKEYRTTYQRYLIPSFENVQNTIRRKRPRSHCRHNRCQSKCTTRRGQPTSSSRTGKSCGCTDIKQLESSSERYRTRVYPHQALIPPMDRKAYGLVTFDHLGLLDASQTRPRPPSEQVPQVSIYWEAKLGCEDMELEPT